jgi:hypothetical protein
MLLGMIAIADRLIALITGSSLAVLFRHCWSPRPRCSG